MEHVGNEVSAERKFDPMEQSLSNSELVSIVVPVFNRAHLIARAVGSLLQQTHRNLEVIVVDDCSNDDIQGAVAAIGDPRVRLIRRQSNGGAGAARNTGIAAAKGAYIAFHDSDDICTFEKIERQLTLLKSLPEDFVGVYCPVLFHYSLDEADYGFMNSYVRPYAWETPLSGDLSARTLLRNSYNLPTLLVHRQALVDAGLFDELLRNNEDWDLALRLTRVGKLKFLPEPMYLAPISKSPAVRAQHISRLPRYSAQSYVRISGKIRHAGLSTPAMAGHYGAAGRYLVMIGHPVLARRFFRAALAEKALAPKYWAHLAFTHLPSLHRRILSRELRLSKTAPLL